MKFFLVSLLLATAFLRACEAPGPASAGRQIHASYGRSPKDGRKASYEFNLCKVGPFFPCAEPAGIGGRKLTVVYLQQDTPLYGFFCTEDTFDIWTCSI